MFMFWFQFREKLAQLVAKYEVERSIFKKKKYLGNEIIKRINRCDVVVVELLMGWPTFGGSQWITAAPFSAASSPALVLARWNRWVLRLLITKHGEERASAHQKRLIFFNYIVDLSWPAPHPCPLGTVVNVWMLYSCWNDRRHRKETVENFLLFSFFRKRRKKKVLLTDRSKTFWWCQEEFPSSFCVFLLFLDCRERERERKGQ